MVPRDVYGVYFICCQGDYPTIVQEQLHSLQKNGLWERTTKLLCFITLLDLRVMKLLEPYKEKMMFFTTQENLYEKFALQKFRSYIPTKRPYHLYYFHTKGVSRGPLESPPPIRVGEEQRVVPRTTFYNTRRNMDYFILEKHDICTWWLGHGYDAVGTALSRHPALHFSGNFWWATSEHLSRLPPLRDSYYGAEMHICSVPGGRYISLCQLTNTHPPSELRRIPDADIIRHSTSVPVENVSDRGMSI